MNDFIRALKESPGLFILYVFILPALLINMVYQIHRCNQIMDRFNQPTVSVSQPDTTFKDSVNKDMNALSNNQYKMLEIIEAQQKEIEDQNKEIESLKSKLGKLNQYQTTGI